MILDAITKKLQVILAGAITTNQLPVVASWADITLTAFTPGNAHTATNSTTAVDIVAAPAASTQRQVKELSVYNADTVAATMTIRLNDSGTLRNIVVITLQAGETLLYADLQGWMVLATNGAIKGSAGVSSVALTVPSILSVAGSPITTAGTLAVTLATQSANTHFAGPISGAAAPPTFRTMVAADLNSLAFTTGSVLFGNSSGGISQDNTGLFFDSTNHFLGIGTGGYATPDAPIYTNSNNGASIAPPAGTTLHSVAPNATTNNVIFDAYGSQAVLRFRRANSTRGSESTISNGDLLSAFVGQGYNTSTYANGAQIQFLASETWSTTANGTEVSIISKKNGTTTSIFALTAINDGRIRIGGSLVDLSYSYQTPAAAATITIADTCDRLILNPAGLLATLTINMPAAPKDGQVCRVSCTKVVTTLTMSGNGNTLEGGLATFAVDGFAEWTYVLSQTTWFRTG